MPGIRSDFGKWSGGADPDSLVGDPTRGSFLSSEQSCHGDAKGYGRAPRTK